jgi:hypothetical protein
MNGRLNAICLTDNNLTEFWPYIRSQLWRVEDRNGCALLPEEVFVSWKSGISAVYVLSWDGNLAGAIVFQNVKRDDKKDELWVWAMALDGIAGREQLESLNEWLKWFCRDIGASSVAMKSSRRGWDRFLSRYGWEPSLIEYKLEVKDGQ